MAESDKTSGTAKGAPETGCCGMTPSQADACCGSAAAKAEACCGMTAAQATACCGTTTTTTED